MKKRLYATCDKPIKTAETFLEMIQLRKRVEKHLKNNHRPVDVSALAKGWKRETDPVYLL